MYASVHGSSSAAEMLLSHKADVDLQSAVSTNIACMSARSRV